MVPGMVLSHPESATIPSSACAMAKSSIESAMISRETSDARMPSVPMEMPSDMAMVLNSTGVPPAARMPALTCSASARRCTLQGVTSVQVFGHAHQRLFEIGLRIAGAFEHGARGGASQSFFESVASHSVLVASSPGRKERSKKTPASLSGAGARVREASPQLGIPHPGRIIRSSTSATRPPAAAQTPTPPSRTGRRDEAADRWRRNIVEASLRWHCGASK